MRGSTLWGEKKKSRQVCGNLYEYRQRQRIRTKTKSPAATSLRRTPLKKRRRPTLPLLRSTIGVTGLNFSVRNGKRWNPGAVATWIVIMTTMDRKKISLNVYTIPSDGQTSSGQLVTLGFGVTTFTPASYRRHRLWRPSKKSYLVAGFALRCFQRLSDPDMDTRQCTWRHNRQTRGRSDTVLSY